MSSTGQLYYHLKELLAAGLISQRGGREYDLFQVARMSQSDFYTQPQRAQNALIAHPYCQRIGENPTGPQNPTEPCKDASSTQGFIGGPDGGTCSTEEVPAWNRLVFLHST